RLETLAQAGWIQICQIVILNIDNILTILEYKCACILLQFIITIFYLYITYTYNSILAYVARGLCEAQWSRPDEDGSGHPSIEAWRGIETMKAIDAFSALVRKETKKETNSSRTWKIETRKQTSQVALSKRSQMAPKICSVTGRPNSV